MAKTDIETIEKSKVRSHWDEDSGQYFFSIVDIIGIVTNSSDARNYWKVLKSRLKNTQKELVTECNQLKMRAVDGKFYLTDTAGRVTILEIIKIVSPENVAVFDYWFNQKDQEKAKNKTPIDSPSFLGEKLDNSQNLTKNGSYPQPEAELLIDAYQTNDEIFISAFVAGVGEKDLSVIITCKEVIIRGNRELKNNISESDLEVHELYWGIFSRTIILPEEIEMDKAEAINSHGVLKLKLPKINKNLRKNIEIKFI